MTNTTHNLQSSYREALLEHLFIGELMRTLWCAEQDPLEVVKPQVDNSGYDIVLEANGVIRHVQMKSSFNGATTASQKINVALERKPSGCVIWIHFDPQSLELGPFLWFGSKPGRRLPDLDGFKIARHTKGDATGVKKERPMIRVVPKKHFESLGSIRDVVHALFGLSV